MPKYFSCASMTLTVGPETRYRWCRHPVKGTNGLQKYANDISRTNMAPRAIKKSQRRLQRVSKTTPRGGYRHVCLVRDSRRRIRQSHQGSYAATTVASPNDYGPHANGSMPPRLACEGGNATIQNQCDLSAWSGNKTAKMFLICLYSSRIPRISPLQ